MRNAYPPYDFIIVGGLTFLFGYFLKRTLFKNKAFKKKFVLVPHAIAFIFVSFGFAFIIDELPLKLYSYEEGVYDPQSQMGPNPQGLTGEAINFLIQYGLSIFINLVLWTYCVILLFRYFFSMRKRAT